MSNEHQWRIVSIEDSYAFTIIDPTECWQMRVKWDGCIDITHCYNGGPLEGAEPRDLAYLHICSLYEMIYRLREAARLIKAQTEPDNDAGEDSRRALDLFKEEVE